MQSITSVAISFASTSALTARLFHTATASSSRIIETQMLCVVNSADRPGEHKRPVCLPACSSVCFSIASSAAEHDPKRHNSNDVSHLHQQQSRYKNKDRSLSAPTQQGARAAQVWCYCNRAHHRHHVPAILGRLFRVPRRRPHHRQGSCVCTSCPPNRTTSKASARAPQRMPTATESGVLCWSC